MITGIELVSETHNFKLGLTMKIKSEHEVSKKLLVELKVAVLDNVPVQYILAEKGQCSVTLVLDYKIEYYDTGKGLEIPMHIAGNDNAEVILPINCWSPPQ